MVVMKKKLLTDSVRYRKVMDERDHALQRLLSKYQASIARVVHSLQNRTLEIVLSEFSRVPIGILQGTGHTIAILNQKLDHEFHAAAMAAYTLAADLRKKTYLMSFVGHNQAMIHALGKTMHISVTEHKTNTVLQIDTLSGGKLPARINLAFTRLKHDVMDKVHLSQVLEDDLKGLEERVIKAFPASRVIQIPRKLLPAMRALHEADAQKTPAPDQIGFVEPEEWQDLLDVYFAKHLPPDTYSRGPDDKTIQYRVNDDGSVDFATRYDWELEQDVTNDFILSVRTGEKASASENGVTDFMWLAVVDGKTDECCLDRDGLTTQEIEQGLQDGTIDEDTCDATSAPAHFNCRCRMVPYADDLPDTPPPDYGSFDDWLEEKAKS